MKQLLALQYFTIVLHALDIEKQKSGGDILTGQKYLTEQIIPNFGNFFLIKKQRNFPLSILPGKETVQFSRIFTGTAY